MINIDLTIGILTGATGGLFVGFGLGLLVCWHMLMKKIEKLELL